MKKHSEEWKRQLSKKMKGNQYARGMKHTEEWKQRMSQIQKGHKYNLGRKHTEECKRKLSETMRGKSTQWLKGKKWVNQEERKKKLSLSMMGNKYAYKNGKSSEIQKRLNETEWRKLRVKIKERDKYTCQICGKTKNGLAIHHIIPYRITRDNSIENLITLCFKCHSIEEHKYYNNLF